MLARLADDHAPLLLGDPPPDVPGGQGQAEGACAAESAEACHRRRLALRAVVTVVTVAVPIVALLAVALVMPVVAVTLVVPVSALVIVALLVPVVPMIAVALLVPVFAVAVVAVPVGPVLLV